MVAFARDKTENNHVRPSNSQSHCHKPTPKASRGFSLKTDLISEIFEISEISEIETKQATSHMGFWNIFRCADCKRGRGGKSYLIIEFHFWVYMFVSFVSLASFVFQPKAGSI